MEIIKKGLPFLIYLFTCLLANAQQTQYFLDAEQGYRKGLSLFDERNYPSAREEFEKIARQPKSNVYHGNGVLMQNVDYYIAVCAVEASDKDAEKLLLDYQKKYHETDKRRILYFYHGKYYYANKKYQEAIDVFTKVNIKDLDNEQIYEYKFQLGYSYFTKKKFTEAKPMFFAVKEIKDKYYYPANYYYAFICFYTKDYDEALKSFTQIEDSKIYSSVIPYYIAQIYFIKKDYPKLVSYINKNLEKVEVQYKEEMKFLLGQVYFQQDEYAKALPLLESYIVKTPKVPKENIYQLAYCQYKTGAYDKAITNLLQLNLLDEKLGQNATYVLGDCYLKTKQKDKARSAFQSAAQISYDATIQQNSLYNYGKLSFELGYSTDAIQSFETYLEKYPDGTYYEEVNELLATALVQTKDYDRAYKMMEKMKMTSPMIKEAYQKVTYFRAVELFNDHKEDEALELVNKSLAYPLNLEVQALATYLKGEVLYNKGFYASAADQFKTFDQMVTPAVEKKGEASKFRALYNIGYCYFKQKQYGEALSYFGNAAEEGNDTKDVKGKTALQRDLYLRMGDCAFIGRNYNKAIDAFTTIVERNWASADYAQYQKGIILGLQGRDGDKSTTMNYLIMKYPTSPYAEQAYYETGETELGTGDMAAARTAYQNLVNKYPNSNLLPKAYLKLAVIDYNTGKKELALEDYKAVVRKYPNTTQEKEALAALKDLYVEVGRPEEYFDFVKKNSNVVISTSEQDSLTYQAANNVYESGDCAKSTTMFANYLSKFPNGFFALEVHWKKSECHIKAKELNAALAELEEVAKDKFSKYYERALVKASGIAYYDIKDYTKALPLYRQLYVAGTTSQNRYSAQLGMFRSAVQLKLQDETIEYADQLINGVNVQEQDKQEAYYEKGKAYYAKGNKETAFVSFNHVAELPVSERCVESKYMVARILNEQGNYKASMDTCFKIKSKYASYEYWIVKTFILIADNYYAEGNTFQAKSTLESIVENYDGDATVVNEAKTKLEKIRTDELNKTKIMMIAPSDTLIMESDSILIDNN